MAKLLLKLTILVSESILFLVYFIWMVLIGYRDIPAAWHESQFHTYFMGVCVSLGVAVIALMLSHTTMNLVRLLYDVVEAIGELLPNRLRLRKLRPYEEIVNAQVHS